jgi:hypothetical protein
VRETSHRVALILQLDGSPASPLGGGSVVVFAVVAIGSFGVLWKAPSVVSFDEPSQVVESAALPPVHLAPKPVNAAWHGPAVAPVARVANRREVTEAPTATPRQIRPRLVRTSMAEMQAEMMFVHSVTIVVAHQDDGFTVWRFTTWQYSPARQARADRKTT